MYGGLDYHKRYSVATVIDQMGKLVEQVKLNNKPQTPLSYVNSLSKGSKIALEAQGSWYYVYGLLESTGTDIYLFHFLKTRAIAEARIKTDKIDSGILAHLLRTDLLPTSYIAQRQIRDIREILRSR